MVVKCVTYMQLLCITHKDRRQNQDILKILPNSTVPNEQHIIPTYGTTDRKECNNKSKVYNTIDFVIFDCWVQKNFTHMTVKNVNMVEGKIVATCDHQHVDKR